MDEWFRDQRLRQIYDYWNSKRQGQRAPRQSDIDLAEIATLLPIIQMIDVDRDPLRFRHRFAGTEIVEWMGRDATGKELNSDLYGSEAEAILDTLRTIVDEGRPYHRTSLLHWHERDWLVMETVELPLLDDAGQVAAILGGACFRPREPGVAETRVHTPLRLPEENDDPPVA